MMNPLDNMSDDEQKTAEQLKVLWESKRYKELRATASNDHSPQSLFYLGRLYRYGYGGVKKDPQAALICFLRSNSKEGFHEGLEVLWINRSSVSTEQLINLFEALESCGVPGASAYLGKVYHLGNGEGTVSFSKAVDSFMRADSDDTPWVVPEMFDCAFKIPNYVKMQQVVGLVRSQADKGDAQCMVRMGRAYKFGKGVRLDPDQSKIWFDKARQTDPSLHITDA